MNIDQAQKIAFYNGYHEALNHVDDLLTKIRIEEANNNCENYSVFNEYMNKLYLMINKLHIEANECESKEMTEK